MIGVVLSWILLIVLMLWFFSICKIMLLSSVFLVLIFDLIVMGDVVCRGKFIVVSNVSEFIYSFEIVMMFFLFFYGFF